MIHPSRPADCDFFSFVSESSLGFEAGIGPIPAYRSGTSAFAAKATVAKDNEGFEGTHFKLEPPLFGQAGDNPVTIFAFKCSNFDTGHLDGKFDDSTLWPANPRVEPVRDEGRFFPVNH